MDLEWENITWSQAEQLMAAYDASFARYGTLVIPPATMAGASQELTTFLLSFHPGTTWHFSGGPTVRPSSSGRCNVSFSVQARTFAVYT